MNTPAIKIIITFTVLFTIAIIGVTVLFFYFDTQRKYNTQYKAQETTQLGIQGQKTEDLSQDKIVQPTSIPTVSATPVVTQIVKTSDVYKTQNGMTTYRFKSNNIGWGDDEAPPWIENIDITAPSDWKYERSLFTATFNYTDNEVPKSYTQQCKKITLIPPNEKIVLSLTEACNNLADSSDYTQTTQNDVLVWKDRLEGVDGSKWSLVRVKQDSLYIYTHLEGVTTMGNKYYGNRGISFEYNNNGHNAETYDIVIIPKDNIDVSSEVKIADEIVKSIILGNK